MKIWPIVVFIFLVITGFMVRRLALRMALGPVEKEVNLALPLPPPKKPGAVLGPSQHMSTSATTRRQSGASAVPLPVAIASNLPAPVKSVHPVDSRVLTKEALDKLKTMGVKDEVLELMKIDPSLQVTREVSEDSFYSAGSAGSRGGPSRPDHLLDTESITSDTVYHACEEKKDSEPIPQLFRLNKRHTHTLTPADSVVAKGNGRPNSYWRQGTSKMFGGNRENRSGKNN